MHARPRRSRVTLSVLPATALFAVSLLVSVSLQMAAAAGPPPIDGRELLREPVGPGWRVSFGGWTLEDGVAQTTGDAPEGLIIHRVYRSASNPMILDVSMSGPGGTVLFGLDDTSDATVGHFVRVAGGMLETGLMRGACMDQLTGRSALPLSADGWTALSITIDPPARTYDILVNGSRAIETQELVCPGGWIGLRSSDASASFRNLTVRTQANTGRASRASGELSVHRLRYIRAGAGNVVVHDPERNLLLAMDVKGKVLKSAPPRFPVRSTTQASAAGRTYTISDGRLIVSRSEQSDGDAGPDTVGSSIVHAVALVADRDGSVYVTDSGSPAVHQVDATGKVVRTWRANLLGGFIAPHGVDLLGSKEIVVADYDRVVILLKGKDEEGADITAGSKNIVVEWTLPSAVTPFAEVSEDGSSWRRVTGESAAAGGKARVVIGSLEPSTSYLVRFGPVVKTIPPSAGVSRVLEASTLSGDPSSAQAR
ncbi:MAG: hypothetical protein H6Q28_153 [Bacteroidetes bacterium]|nr:hypothetical protein [Bacteroidota bacterium]